MKASLTYEYDPEEPHESDVIKRMLQAPDMLSAIQGFDESLKNLIDALEDERLSNQADQIRTLLHEALNNYGLTLYD